MNIIMGTATITHAEGAALAGSEEETLAGCIAAADKRKEANAPAAKAPPQGGLAGMLWFTGWLFTIGFAQLVWWKAILGLVLWPYFLALALR